MSPTVGPPPLAKLRGPRMEFLALRGSGDWNLHGAGFGLDRGEGSGEAAGLPSEICTYRSPPR